MHRLDKLNSIKDYIPLIKHDTHGKNIGLRVDGPNMLRKEFDCNLDTVKDLIAEYGNIKVGKVFLNQYASDKLIEAVVNQGFSPMIVAEKQMSRWLWRHLNLFTILILTYLQL
jgi:uncharacterized protein (TIGR00288 family)